MCRIVYVCGDWVSVDSMAVQSLHAFNACILNQERWSIGGEVDMDRETEQKTRWEQDFCSNFLYAYFHHRILLVIIRVPVIIVQSGCFLLTDTKIKIMKNTRRKWGHYFSFGYLPSSTASLCHNVWKCTSSIFFCLNALFFGEVEFFKLFSFVP